MKVRGGTFRERIAAGQYSIDSGITAFIGRKGSGAAGLSYLVSGCCPLSGCSVSIDGRPLTQRELSRISCLMAPMPGFKGMLTAKQLLRLGIRHNKSAGYDAAAVAEKFSLTPERMERKLQYNGNERYRAAAAVGYAYGKRIYSMGYMEDYMFQKNYKACLIPYLELLRDEGMTVVLAADSAEFAEKLADHIYYFDKEEQKC